MRSFRVFAVALFAVALPHTSAFAQARVQTQTQPPLAFGPLQDPATLDTHVRTAVSTVSGGYRLVGYRVFAGDSIMLVYDDSSLTASAIRANKWMFGPPTTVAEADGCPPEKVLGRQIARELWRQLGKPKTLQQVVITVRGTVGIDRWTAEDMYYYPVQLDGPWVGDPKHPPGKLLNPATAIAMTAWLKR